MLRAFALGAALLVGATACSDSEPTAPNAPNRNIDSRLVTTIASTLDNTTALSGSTVLSVSYQIRNETGAEAQTGTCGSLIEARTAGRTTWTDVTFTNQVCNMLAVVMAPGDSRTFGILADVAKVREVAPAGTTVTFRIVHPFLNDRSAMSGEVNWTVR